MVGYSWNISTFNVHSAQNAQVLATKRRERVEDRLAIEKSNGLAISEPRDGTEILDFGNWWSNKYMEYIYIYIGYMVSKDMLSIIYGIYTYRISLGAGLSYRMPFVDLPATRWVNGDAGLHQRSLWITREVLGNVSPTIVNSCREIVSSIFDTK